MYNLIVDSEFNNNWTSYQCTYNNGMMCSDSKLFYMSQKLIVDEKSKIYFRFNFKALSDLGEIKIGIKVDDVLYTNQRYPKLNSQRIISIVEDVQDTFEVFIICEGYNKDNKIEIKQPLLLNLTTLNLENQLKEKLDQMQYRKGISYKNLLPLEIKEVGVPTKFGSYIEVDNELLNKKIDYPIEENKNYVYKLRIEELNQFGSIYISYGNIRSKRIGQDLIIAFKGSAKYCLELNLNHDPRYTNKYSILLKSQLLAQVDNLEWGHIKMLGYVG